MGLGGGISPVMLPRGRGQWAGSPSGRRVAPAEEEAAIYEVNSSGWGDMPCPGWPVEGLKRGMVLTQEQAQGSPIVCLAFRATLGPQTQQLVMVIMIARAPGGSKMAPCGPVGSFVVVKLV